MSSCQLDKKSRDYCHSYLKPSVAGGSTSPGHSENMTVYADTHTHTQLLVGCMWSHIKKSLFSLSVLSTTGEWHQCQL